MPRRRPSGPPRSRKRPTSSAGSSKARAREAGAPGGVGAEARWPQDVDRARGRRCARKWSTSRSPSASGSSARACATRIIAGSCRTRSAGSTGQLAVRPTSGPPARYAKALFDVAREAGATEAIGQELEQVAASSRGRRGELDVRAPAPVDQARRAPRRWRWRSRRARRRASSCRTSWASWPSAAGPIICPRSSGPTGRSWTPSSAAPAPRCGPRSPSRTERSASSRRKLERALGKRIILEEQVDATLLGGFIAQVGSLIFDGSLDGQLARMRQRLARG